MFGLTKAREILETCLNACDSTPQDYSFYELKELFADIRDNTSNEDDFTIELCGGECRLIDSSAIGEIWTESLIDQIKECYDLSNLPEFVSIDWEQTAENCKVDGMGHHFASYDHEEHESNGFHIFRTN